MAAVVGVGTRAESAPAEAHGRPTLHRGRPAAYAGAGNGLPSRCRHGTMGGVGATPSARVGSHCRTTASGRTAAGDYRVSCGREPNMSTPYLEVTYRRGRPIAAYYYPVSYTHLTLPTINS